MYLVDTNVLSAGAPTKAKPMLDLVGWMERNSERLYLSVITVAEVEDGIAKARREGAHHKAERLAEWLDTLLHLYSARILPLRRCRSPAAGGFVGSGPGGGAGTRLGRLGDRRDGSVAGLHRPDPEPAALSHAGRPGP